MRHTNRRWWLAGAAVLIITACVGTLIWNTLQQKQSQLTAAQINQKVKEQYPGQITQIIQETGIYQVQLKSEQGTYELIIDGRSGEIQAIKQVKASPITADDSIRNHKDTAAPASNSDTAAKDDSDMGTPSSNKTATSTSADGNDSNSDSTNIPHSDASDSASNDSNRHTDKTIPTTSKPSDPQSSAAVSVTGAQAENIALDEVKGEVDDVKYEHNSKNGQQYYLVEIDTFDDREAVVQINSITGAVMSVTWDEEDDDEQ